MCVEPRRQRRSPRRPTLIHSTNERPAQQQPAFLARARAVSGLPAPLRPHLSEPHRVPPFTLSPFSLVSSGGARLSTLRLPSSFGRPTSSSSVLLSFVLELQSEDHCEPHIALPPGPGVARTLTCAAPRLRPSRAFSNVVNYSLLVPPSALPAHRRRELRYIPDAFSIGPRGASELGRLCYPSHEPFTVG